MFKELAKIFLRSIISGVCLRAGADLYEKIKKKMDAALEEEMKKRTAKK